MLKLLKRFGGKFRRYMIIGPACKLIEVLFDLVTPLVIAQMIDRGIGAHDVQAVIHYGVLLGIMSVIGISFTLVCQKMAALTSQGMGTDIRAELYAHINTLGYAELDRFGTPSLITRITNDVNQVQLAVALGVRMLIRWPFLAVGSMVAALLIDLKLGLIFLVCTPVIGFVFWFVMARCIPFFKQMQRKLDRIALICREGLSGARVVRAFVREEYERERFASAATDQAETAIAVGRLSSVLNPVTFLVMNLGVCAILWTGGIQVDTGALTQGQVMAFVNYMTQTLTSIVYVANLVVVFTKASASASRINEVLECQPSITDAGATPVELPSAGGTAEAGSGADSVAGAAGVADESCGGGAAGAAGAAGESCGGGAAGTAGVAGEGCGGGVAACDGVAGDGAAAAAGAAAEAASSSDADTAPGLAAGVAAGQLSVPALRLDHVSFAFGEGAANAVDDVSLTLELGGTLGIIGGTGSGKSTLVSLVPRLYDASRGTVEVMGRDVRAWPLAQLRRVVGIVPQRATLVSGTIRSNLQWRDPEATDDELWAALDTAQASEFVRKMPQGLDTPVEAGGKNFSGGQRQRLTIARALVGTPQILIMDDSASALDFKTDSALRRAVHERSVRGSAEGSLPLTTLIVSQRVSTVRDADVICVLDHGKLAGLGTHDELYRTCSLYREICQSQLRREELEGTAPVPTAQAVDAAIPAVVAGDAPTGGPVDPDAPGSVAESASVNVPVTEAVCEASSAPAVVAGSDSTAATPAKEGC